ncbi:gas vesicle protein [Natrinema sp. 1APR25-10V2]|uniref:gas vesicle protein GvpJ n=1 Tax=Natrinema sp. 1APR25-10V2 TaxID=2951081 RepID=UPI0028771B8A|nr:gas vesicle protein [Natrinema sp. 1APR25-10V2]MDS0474879.1 gas vesicle protein [Natrinema sp. 1APR25-10V2]
MVDEFQPSRQKADLAEVVEMLLDKGIVINADIAVSIGDTQLLGVQLRAAIASFETAAKYGLEFPEGTDMQRVAEAVDDPEIAEAERPNPVIDPTRGVNATAESDTDPDRSDDDGEPADESQQARDDEDLVSQRLGARPDPERPTSGGFDLLSDDDSDADDSETEAAESDEESESETEDAAPEAKTESEGDES